MTMTMTPGLADHVIARDPRAVARAISLIENESPDAADLVRRIYPRTGHAYLIGVTGPPGAGKSTLVDRVIAEFRRAGKTVGVLAVDPTSPYTGGAILGDRVRMQTHAQDEGVFIRSMATRGHLGGLARTTADAAMVLDAAGCDVVMIETVGVGQDEVDIVRTADIAIVVLVPGAGDDVQALKAGIMEIADIFVVNKADREGADRAAATIEAMLAFDERSADAWHPPVIRTEATSGRGVTDVMTAIDRFQSASTASLGERRRARVAWRLRETLGRQFVQQVETDVLAGGEFDQLVQRIADREIDPYSAVASVLSLAAPARRAFSIDHVGVAVTNAAEYMTLFDRLFGLKTDEPSDVGVHRIRFIQTGESTIELVEPLAPEAPIAKFLDKHGPGLHHVCLFVPDIDAVLADLKARGVALIDQTPRHSAHGARIAFIHPSSTHGLLVELKQR
jgi:GTPase